MALNLRYHRNILVPVCDNIDRAVSDKLIASDREAGEILRYALKRDASYADRRNAKVLATEYPQNEFFLAEWVEKLASVERPDLQETLAVVDKLLALEPENAHYRYLKGWVLLRIPGAEERLAEALEQFELGNRLAYFRLPYRGYKERVDRIAERAVLGQYNRPRIEAFYPDLGEILTSGPRWKNVDQDLRRRLIAAGWTMAARVIRSAYDMDSLCEGAEMMEQVEEARLRELPPSGPWEDRERRWPELAHTLDNLRWSWGERLWVTSPHMASTLPWLIPVFAFVSLLRVRSRLALPQTANAAKTPSALVMASVILVSLVVFMVACKWNLATGSGVILAQAAWFVSLLSWCTNPEVVPFDDRAKGTASRSIRSWPAAAYALLWFDGAILISISNSSFFQTGDFSEWSPWIPILGIWSAFWALLWISRRDRQLVFGRVPYQMAVTLAFYAAVALLLFDVFGGRWRWESRAYAEPLSLCPSLPPLVKEIRETARPEILSPFPAKSIEDDKTRTQPRSFDNSVRRSYPMTSTAGTCPRSTDAFGVPAGGLSRSTITSKLCASSETTRRTYQGRSAIRPA